MRYATEKPHGTYRGDGWASYANSTADTLHEREPEYTGLLDVSGRRIVKVMEPIGFVRPKEAS